MLCPAVGLEHSKKVRELLYRRILRAWGHNTKTNNLDTSKLTFARAENPQSDLNNLRATGLYRYGVSTVSNLPTYDTDSFFVLVIEFSATYILQVYIGFYDTTTQSCHIRALWGTQWKSWRELS